MENADFQPKDSAPWSMDGHQLRRIVEEADFFRVVFDALPMPVTVKSAKPASFGQYLLWNEAAAAAWGFSAGETIGKTDRDLREPDAGERILALDHKAIALGKCFATDEETGGAVLRTTRIPIPDSEGRPLALLAVAELRQDPAAAGTHERDREFLLANLLENLPVCTFAKSARPETWGRYILWNRMMAQYYGVPAGEAIGRTAREVFGAKVAAEWEQQDETVFHSRERLNIPLETFESASGGNHFLHVIKAPVFDDHGALTAIIGVAEDITERIEANEALRASEERWDLALAGTEAGVWDWDVRTGELFFSDRWREMFGYAQDELPGNPRALLELVHPDHRQEVRAATLRHMRRRTELFRCEYRMLCRDGSYLWVIVHAKAHFDAHGARRMIGTFIDISERKRVEEQLLQAKIAAETASRAKSDFLAMMSHEIRTPLNGVIGFAELLTETPLDQRQGEYVQTVCESGANLLHVLDDILDYSKIESGRLAIEVAPVAIRELAASAAEVFRARADAKGLRLDVHIGSEVPDTLMGDMVRIRQILTNLVSNAVKFTSRGGVSITLASGPRPAGPGHFALRMMVADTGPGIAEEDLPLLFTPFQQLDVSMARRFGGTGLGLAIVRRLLDMMKGSVEVASTPGRGVTFIIDLPLPLATRAAGRPASTPGAAGRIAGELPLEILLVEDNTVNRRLALLMLEKLGYVPEEAVDGPDAIRKAAARKFDLILMDIQMPGMDGYEAASRIRAAHTDDPPLIAALTAHAMQSDRDRSLAHGMFRHVTKPLRIDDLKRLVEAAARERKFHA